MCMGWASHAVMWMNGAIEGRAVATICNPSLPFHAPSVGSPSDAPFPCFKVTVSKNGDTEGARARKGRHEHEVGIACGHADEWSYRGAGRAHDLQSVTSLPCPLRRKPIGSTLSLL